MITPSPGAAIHISPPKGGYNDPPFDFQPHLIEEAVPFAVREGCCYN